MDTLYLKRFNQNTAYDTLLDEHARLASEDYDFTQEFMRTSHSLRYSEAQRIANKLATIRSQYHYIERMLRIVGAETHKSTDTPHASNYYGDPL